VNRLDRPADKGHYRADWRQLSESESESESACTMRVPYESKILTCTVLSFTTVDLCLQYMNAKGNYVYFELSSLPLFRKHLDTRIYDELL
jgi:hypothetical protein